MRGQHQCPKSLQSGSGLGPDLFFRPSQWRDFFGPAKGNFAQSQLPNPVVKTFILFSQAPESISLVDDNADNDEEKVFKVAVFNQVEN